MRAARKDGPLIYGADAPSGVLHRVSHVASDYQDKFAFWCSCCSAGHCEPNASKLVVAPSWPRAVKPVCCSNHGVPRWWHLVVFPPRVGCVVSLSTILRWGNLSVARAVFVFETRLSLAEHTPLRLRLAGIAFDFGRAGHGKLYLALNWTEISRNIALPVFRRK